jgi:hypothetical protein
MGKASQAKKVARAARAAGPAPRSRRRWLWPAGILLIFIVGGLVIYAARGQSNPVPTPQIANEDTTTTLDTSVASTPVSASGSTVTTVAGSTASTTATTAPASTSTTATP